MYAHEFEAPAAPLHMSKVAVGCASIETLRKRQQGRAANGEVPLVTRFMPKRAAEMIGGSVYWIVKHQLIARQRIAGFAEREEDNRTIIRLDQELIAVRPFPKRAHQGWRYLTAGEAPLDFTSEVDSDALPADLMRQLIALALV